MAEHSSFPTIPPEVNQPRSIFPSHWRLRHRYRVLITRSIIPFAWPIFIELACVVLIGIISTVLVSKIGKDAIAAVGLTNSITYIVLSLFGAIALGGTVLIAQAFGLHNQQKRQQGAAHAINLNLLASLVCGTLFYCFTQPIFSLIASEADAHVLRLADQYLKMIALSYPAIALTLSGSSILRAMGNSRTPAMINILMNILNIILSLPCIYGIEALNWDGLGVLGAGIGLCTARWIGAGMILFSLSHYRSQPISLKILCQPLRWAIVKDILFVGIPTSVESIMFNVGKLVTQIMVAGMGTDVMAGNIITFSILLFVNIPGNALAKSATILVGKRLGQGRTYLAQLEVRLLLAISSVSQLTLSLLLIPFAPWITTLYSHDPDVITIVTHLIELNAIMIVLWSPSFVLPAAFKGAKDVQYSMWTAILSMWGCRIICGYTLGIIMELGIYGIWLGMYIDWGIKSSLYLYRLYNGRWLHTSVI